MSAPLDSDLVLLPAERAGYTEPMIKRNLGVAAVFLLGCATGAAASGLVVPPASAQQPATLTRW